MLDAFAEVSSGAIFSAAWSALSFAVSAKPCAASAATGIFSLTLVVRGLGVLGHLRGDALTRSLDLLAQLVVSFRKTPA